jgi:hypothetical protein
MTFLSSFFSNPRQLFGNGYQFIPAVEAVLQSIVPPFGKPVRPVQGSYQGTGHGDNRISVPAQSNGSYYGQFRIFAVPQCNKKRRRDTFQCLNSYIKGRKFSTSLTLNVSAPLGFFISTLTVQIANPFPLTHLQNSR